MTKPEASYSVLPPNTKSSLLTPLTSEWPARPRGSKNKALIQKIYASIIREVRTVCSGSCCPDQVRDGVVDELVSRVRIAIYRAKGHFLGIVATPQKVLSAVTLLIQLNQESKGMRPRKRTKADLDLERGGKPARIMGVSYVQLDVMIQLTQRITSPFWPKPAYIHTFPVDSSKVIA
jgi:hypothetical protein